MIKLWRKITDKPLLKAFLHYYQVSDSELTSVAVAYYWLISIFPLLMIAVNILPYFQIPISDFLITLKEFLPDTIYDVVAKIAREVLTQPSAGLLSFAVISALWTFSKSMNFLQKSFNKAYGIAKNRGIISHQLMSLLVSLGLQILFAIALFLSMFGHMLLDLLKNYWKSESSLFAYLQDFTGPLIYALLFAILIMLYYFLPNVKVGRIRYVLPGSLFVLLTLISLLTIFSAYFNNYVNYLVDVRFFSSIIVVVMMFWFIIIAKILIIGAVINASVQSLKDPNFKAKQ
ncbi:YihY/virulence factor BrkB family protein [Streptococcus sp. DTU_2020_1001019_1_SI_AUS_MUR_006]|uniref:YihY/virulence factor BrkB family protein n=1 Tax=Streptococcus sp. DTU_2020_1001019_1_SI_AUS_MUR_006 TaxID=3077584 RepID=UPI0028EA9D49|nr:YihY/virulence factor BrkB family protein [Streptococcus sp. DTU_2020_1001019_1_SI_AUS_MUR_006]WNS71572.1 YihY/virulence factor BrkB family protein [Streptococcus sp. DTU_2020_1001019_1_SI_AUS_MUR_006]